MNDRKKDDAAPLAPRRPLSGPSGGRSDGLSGQHTRPAPASSPPPGPRPADRPMSSGQPTQTMPPVAAGPVVPPAPPGTRAPTKKSQPTQAKTTPAPRTSGKSMRRARLQLVRVDPWSVMKMAFALSIAIAVVTVVAVAIVWGILSAAGVWDAINSSVEVVLEQDADGFDVTNYVGLGRVLGLTLVVAAADVVLLTAIATLGAFLYNMAASLLGGLEITLAEDR